MKFAFVPLLIALLSAPRGDARDPIYQYFSPSATSATSGAYLWLPPAATRVRAVMIGIHNGLPAPILQHPDVREVCRRHDIAQVLLTPNGSDIGGTMLKDLNFDFTDPAKTAIHDRYLAALAEACGHPELATAPVIPLAHSAYASFPFDVAMRDPGRCLAALPIKAGLPDCYGFYAAGGKSRSPAPGSSLRHVPILFLASASQETVGWSAYPRDIGSTGFLQSYRRDLPGLPDDRYQPRNELFGVCWEMTAGHFDLLPRNFRFVADWLDAIATARLPATAGEPLRDLLPRDGWLVPARVPVAGSLPADFPRPAPYAAYTGDRRQALWFPTAKLAETQFALFHDEPRRRIEMFTFRDADGFPLPLAHGHLAEPPPNPYPLAADGSFRMETHHFTAPFPVCTVKERGHPESACSLENLGFPGKSTLPVSRATLGIDFHGAPLELLRQETFTDDRGVTETRFTLRLVRHRLTPEAGYIQCHPRVHHQGDDGFAAAGRTTRLVWTLPDLARGGRDAPVDFPAIADAPATAERIPLGATAPHGGPVEYFVVHGPGVIRGTAFVPAEVPAGLRKPIRVTIGAYQNGRYDPASPVKPSPTVYRTFHLLPS